MHSSQAKQATDAPGAEDETTVLLAEPVAHDRRADGTACVRASARAKPTRMHVSRR